MTSHESYDDDTLEAATTRAQIANAEMRLAIVEAAECFKRLRSLRAGPLEVKYASELQASTRRWEAAQAISAQATSRILEIRRGMV